MSEVSTEDRPKGRSLRPLKMLGPYIAPYRGVLMVALIALLISSAALLAMPMAVRNVIDHGFSVEDAANVDRYFFILMMFALVIGFFGAARAYFVNWLGERVVADLRTSVFDHVVRMDPTFFETTKIGEVLSRLTADTTLIQSISGVGVSIVLRSTIQFFGGLIMLAVTHIKLLGILVIILPLIVAPILLVGRWLRRLSRESQDRVADASGHAGEVLGNAQVVQSYTAEALESARFGHAIDISFRTAIRRIRVRALMTIVASTGVFGALIFVLWIADKARSVMADTLDAPQTIARTSSSFLNPRKKLLREGHFCSYSSTEEAVGIQYVLFSFSQSLSILYTVYCGYSANVSAKRQPAPPIPIIFI